MTAFTVDPSVLAQTSSVLRLLATRLYRVGPWLDAAAHLPAPAAGAGIGAAASAMAQAWDGVCSAMTQELGLLADDVAAGAQLYLQADERNAAGFRGAQR